MICHRCGNSIPSGTKYCAYCGIQLQKSSATLVSRVSPRGSSGVPHIARPSFPGWAKWATGFGLSTVIALIIWVVLSVGSPAPPRATPTPYLAPAVTTPLAPTSPLTPLEGLTPLEQQAGMSAYTNVGQTIGLSKAQNAYGLTVNEAGGFAAGLVSPSENIYSFVHKDGWIVVYYPKDRLITQGIRWNQQLEWDVIQGLNKKLVDISRALGVNMGDAKYYHFQYPTATKLATFGDWLKVAGAGDDNSGEETFSFTVRNDAKTYEGSWYQYGSGTYYVGSHFYLDGRVIGEGEGAKWGQLTSKQLSPGNVHTAKATLDRFQGVILQNPLGPSPSRLIVAALGLVYSGSQVSVQAKFSSHYDLERPSLSPAPTSTPAIAPPSPATPTPASKPAVSNWAAPKAWNPVWTTTLSKPVHSLDTDGTRVVTDALFGIVHALDATNGKTIWTYSVTPYEGGASGSSDAVVIDGDTVFVGGPHQTVYALTLSDGRLIWKLSLERYANVTSTLSLSVAEGILLVGSGSGFVAAVNKTSGQLLWEFSTQGQVYSAPQSYDDVALVGAWEIYGLDMRTGALVWQFDPKGHIPTYILLSGNTLYVASADKTAYALDARTGKLLWRADLDDQANSLPVIGLNRVFVATYRTVFALDLSTGKLVWSRSRDRFWGNQLVLVGSDLVVLGDPNSNDNIYVLSADTGEILRSLSNPRAWFVRAREKIFLVNTATAIHLLRNIEVTAPTSTPTAAPVPTTTPTPYAAMFSPGTPTTENFTTYTEVNPENRVIVTSNEVDFSGVNFRGTNTYIYKDKGVDYFNGDFAHLLTFNISSLQRYALITLWMLANTVDSGKVMLSGNKDYLNFEFYQGDSGLFQLRIHEFVNGVQYEDGWTGGSLSTTYYVMLKRDEGIGNYGRLYCYIYSDSGRTALVKTLQLDLHQKIDFRYVYALNTHNDGQIYRASGFVRDLRLQ